MRKIPKKVKRFLFFSIIASLLTAALLLFPSCWGPWVAEKVILSILPSSDNSLDIEVIGKNTLRISKIELKRLPMAPSCSNIEVQYSLPSLIRKHIKSVPNNSFIHTLHINQMQRIQQRLSLLSMFYIG